MRCAIYQTNYTTRARADKHGCVFRSVQDNLTRAKEFLFDWPDRLVTTSCGGAGKSTVYIGVRTSVGAALSCGVAVLA